MTATQPAGGMYGDGVPVVPLTIGISVAAAIPAPITRHTSAGSPIREMHQPIGNGVDPRGRHVVSNSTVSQQHDPVGVGRADRVVGNHHHCPAVDVHCLPEQGQNLCGGTGVERARRLIAEDDIRAYGQRTRNGHALLFAAGQLGRTVSQPPLQADT